ncbi:MAG: hypothetical protein U9Q92_06720 [archaeon]|nr:hypothetical protein [archaeon]
MKLRNLNGKNVCRVLYVIFFILINVNLVQAIDIYHPTYCVDCNFADWEENQYVANDNSINGSLTVFFEISTKDIKKGVLKDNLTIASREGSLEITHLDIVSRNNASIKIDIDWNKVSTTRYEVTFPEDIIELFPPNEWIKYLFKINLTYKLSNFATKYDYGDYSFTSMSLCQGKCDQIKIIKIPTNKYKITSVTNREKCHIPTVNIDCFYFESDTGSIREEVSYYNTFKRNKLTPLGWSFVGALIGAVIGVPISHLIQWIFKKNKKGKYIGSRKSDRYHTIKHGSELKNKVYFSNVIEARDKGYKPCKICKPH